MTTPRYGDRAGMSLVELVIGMVIGAIVLGALVGMFAAQSRMYGEQESQRTARAAVRTASQALASDLRRTEASGGVEAASAEAVTIRVPFALGLVCASSGATTTASLLPADSVTAANAALSGFAVRQQGEGYTYVATTTAADGDGDVCTDESITTLPGGRVVQLSPGAGATVAPGTPVFLYQRVRYEFSIGDDGATLVRTVLESETAEALVETFEASGTRFRYFVGTSNEAQDDPPADLGMVRGVALVLEGMGDRPRPGGESVATAPFTTVVFFRNRPD